MSWLSLGVPDLWSCPYRRPVGYLERERERERGREVAGHPSVGFLAVGGGEAPFSGKRNLDFRKKKNSLFHV